MLDRANRVFSRHALIVHPGTIEPDTAAGRATAALSAVLGHHGVEVTAAATAEDARAVVASDASVACFFVDWALPSDEGEHVTATELLHAIRRRNATAPIFLIAERDEQRSITVEVMELVTELVSISDETADFIAGRTQAAIQRYYDHLLPPFLVALVNYDREGEYAWAVPGHQGGVGYTKHPVGRVFYDFYGENLFRTDMGIERVGLGSLLDHTGPIGASERYAARIFGAQRSYCGLVGTSGSNRTVMSAVLNADDIALIDRNCHKSVMQGLQITGAVPVYMVPSRNRYGIIGPIHPGQMTPQSISAAIAASPLVEQAEGRRPTYAVVANCTYDGMCYAAARAEDLLDASTDVIHFDEAWYGYARFNPMYADRFAMRGDPAEHSVERATVIATTSTHKLLAALSQGSFIHLREGRRRLPHGRFNEAYMMHATTSPLYTIIASNDVASAMMDGPGGVALIQETIDEAVAFRQALARAHRHFAERGEWFFAPWNADVVTDPASGERIPFDEAPVDLLAHEPACWLLRAGDAWHGFDGLDDDWCMLDPTKAGILAPGMQLDGTLADTGVPAALVTAYLARHAIVPSRTTDHIVLCLFAVGITKGKWGTLVNTLLAFKRDYDANAPLAQVLPALTAAHPQRYGSMGLRDLGDEMWSHMQKSEQGRLLERAFATVPEPYLTPRHAYQRLVGGDVELVAFDDLADRVLAVGLQPYPPGIPILLPGESAGPPDGPILRYLRTFQSWDQRFPGFEHEVEGSEQRDGRFFVYCVNES